MKASIFLILFGLGLFISIDSVFAQQDNQEVCAENMTEFMTVQGEILCINDDAYILEYLNWLTEQLGDFINVNNTIIEENNVWNEQRGDEYFETIIQTGSRHIGQFATTASKSVTGSIMADSDDMLGFAVGGAQDVNNFRENIKAGYLPLHTDITPEGLFYDYYFDTGFSGECEHLFCPSFIPSVSPHPFSGEDEYWISVGLNSGIKESDFERSDLDLVIVLDVSGSMSSDIEAYHYDNPNARAGFESVSKMLAASHSVAGIVDHLGENDTLGIVLFDDDVHVARELLPMKGVDRETLKDNILGVYPDGGTYMEGGMLAGLSLFNENLCNEWIYWVVDEGSCILEGDDIKNTDDGRSKRIIFLTDAMPNLGNIDPNSLLGMVNTSASNNIYTTFIGIGLDFNTELIEEISKVRGANYYSVHSAEDFNKRMVEEFEFMVTPLVFDLNLTVKSDNWEIEKIYGSPEANESTGEILKVNTLFPSSSEDGKVKGGIILLKMKMLGNGGNIMISTSYEDKHGNIGGESVEFTMTDEDNDGTRKGILLSRYANLMQGWIIDERADNVRHLGEVVVIDDYFNPPSVNLGRWERTSIDLYVSDEWRLVMEKFLTHFENEVTFLMDDDLQMEIDILNMLKNWDNKKLNYEDKT